MHLLQSIKRFYASSIGKKLLVALSGIVLLGFLFGHLMGNLLIYVGRAAINDYGELLHHFLHGWGIWMARLGLLAALVVHVMATIHLVQENREARGEGCACESTVRASKASRTMMVTGMVTLSFIIFHVLHFTILPGPEDKAYYDQVTSDHLRPDVYGMVVRGFNNIFISLFYIVSMGFLCFHLSHGFASVFQTLGLQTEKSASLVRWLGCGYAGFIFCGNTSIPIAVLLGLVKP